MSFLRKKKKKTLKLQLLGTDLKDNINASLEHFSALSASGYSSTRFDKQRRILNSLWKCWQRAQGCLDRKFSLEHSMNGLAKVGVVLVVTTSWTHGLSNYGGRHLGMRGGQNGAL